MGRGGGRDANNKREPRLFNFYLPSSLSQHEAAHTHTTAKAQRTSGSGRGSQVPLLYFSREASNTHSYPSDRSRGRSILRPHFRGQPTSRARLPTTCKEHLYACVVLPPTLQPPCAKILGPWVGGCRKGKGGGSSDFVIKTHTKRT